MELRWHVEIWTKWEEYAEFKVEEGPILQYGSSPDDNWQDVPTVVDDTSY